MDWKWIEEIQIERRGEDGGRNITMFLEPPDKTPVNAPTYSQLVEMAEGAFRGAMKCGAKGFVMTHADVMAWSSRRSGLHSAYRYRVSADFCPPGKVCDDPEYD